MITPKQIDEEYVMLMNELVKNKSMSKGDIALISMGVMTFMKRLREVIDGNLDDMHHGSLQEEE